MRRVAWGGGGGQSLRGPASEGCCCQEGSIRVPRDVRSLHPALCGNASVLLVTRVGADVLLMIDLSAASEASVGRTTIHSSRTVRPRTLTFLQT